MIQIKLLLPYRELDGRKKKGRGKPIDLPCVATGKKEGCGIISSRVERHGHVEQPKCKVKNLPERGHTCTAAYSKKFALKAANEDDTTYCMAAVQSRPRSEERSNTYLSR